MTHYSTLLKLFSDKVGPFQDLGFLFDNIGNISSMRSIAGTLNGLGVKTNANTVDGYVAALCDAFLFRKARRYDIRGKEILSSGCKYYAADIGLRTRLCGNRVGDAGRILENIVYLELLRRTTPYWLDNTMATRWISSCATAATSATTRFRKRCVPSRRGGASSYPCSPSTTIIRKRSSRWTKTLHRTCGASARSMPMLFCWDKTPTTNRAGDMEAAEGGEGKIKRKGREG